MSEKACFSSIPQPRYLIQVHGAVRSIEPSGCFVIDTDRIRMHPGSIDVRFSLRRNKSVVLEANARITNPYGQVIDIKEGSEVEAIGRNDGVGSVLKADAVVIYPSPSAGWADPSAFYQIAKSEEDEVGKTWDASRLPSLLKGGSSVCDYLQTLEASSEDALNATIAVEEIGLSQKGRPILMVTISGKGLVSESPARVMVIAAQHGDEPAGMRAMLELIRQFAASRDQRVGELLEKVTLHIIPVSNPDGSYSFSRKTANGMNMNRDWHACSLPESQAVMEKIWQYQPDVLIDLHEQTPRDKEGAYVTGVPASEAAPFLMAIRAAFKKHHVHIPIMSEGIGGSNTLLHRQFGLNCGRAGLLVESKYTGSLAANLKSRSSVHLIAVMAVVKALAAQQ